MPDWEPRHERVDEILVPTDTPQELGLLADGRLGLISGRVQEMARLCHLQGDNIYGFTGTCGIVSAEEILEGFGIHTSENELVTDALSRGLCTFTDSPQTSGGTTCFQQSELLTSHGVSSSVDFGLSIDDLAQRVEEGRGVIAEVNAGFIWSRADCLGSVLSSNHAIVVTGVSRDPASGKIQGFLINDSGSNEKAKFVDADIMRCAFEWTGGQVVYTNPRLDSEIEMHGNNVAVVNGYHDQYGVWWSGGHPYYDL